MAEPCTTSDTRQSSETVSVFPFDNDQERDWYGIQVMPRHEKRVTATLETKKLTTFLPAVTEVHRWSDRKQRVEMPLFPGYVFVKLSRSVDERVTVLRSAGVVRIVGNEYMGTPIPAKDIEHVWTLVNSRLNLQPYPFLSAGDRVRIRTGSLANVEGILIGKNANSTLVVSVNLLQRSVAVKIQGFEIDRIGPVNAGVRAPASSCPLVD